MARKLIYSVIVIIILAFNKENSFAQDTLIQSNLTEYKSVIQINEVPNKNNDSQKTFIKKFQDFLFGKNPSVITKPIALAVDQNDIIWVTDQGIKSPIRIKKGVVDIPFFINKNTNLFQSPVGICMISDSKFLITESFFNSVYVFDPVKKTINNFCDSIQFQQPTGIAYSKITKEIWVVETGAHKISVIDEHGKLVKKIGKRGKNPGEFNFPTFIWIDKLGTIYVVDSLNFRIQIFDTKGNLISLFGEQGDGTGNFGIAKGIAVDSSGNIYVTDALFHAVQIFDKSGNFLYSFGSQGKGKGQFWMPAGIYIDENNHIYVADSYNARIQVFKVINKNKKK